MCDKSFFKKLRTMENKSLKDRIEIYIYMYIYMYVCVRVLKWNKLQMQRLFCAYKKESCGEFYFRLVEFGRSSLAR